MGPAAKAETRIWQPKPSQAPNATRYQTQGLAHLGARSRNVAREHHVITPVTRRPIAALRLFQDDPRRRHLQCNALQRSLQARNTHHLLLGGGTKATRLRTQGTLHSKGAAPRRRTVRRLRNRALLAQRPRNPSTYTQQRQRHRQTPRRTRGPTHPTRTLQVSRRRRC